MDSVPIIKETLLPNGLRIVAIDLPDFHSITSFIVLKSGSRYETDKTNGLAHFFEHMAFKGTRRFPDTLALARAIEGIGGYFNAWTANDHTVYWNAVPAGRWQRGLEIALELAFYPTIRAEDLERERGVIIEEIRRIQDDPASLVDDLLGEALFPNHPLGWSIAGKESNIRELPVEAFREYHTKHYTPNRAALVVVGPVADLDIEREVESLLNATLHNGKQDFLPVTDRKREAIIREKKTDQTHLMIGMALDSLSLTGENRYPAAVLNTVLGQGMSSRLFMNIRERRGLAYAVGSSFGRFQDVGLISIYAGLNTGKIPEAIEAFNEELEQLTKELVGAEEFSNAKSALIGSAELAADQPVELAKWYGAGQLLGQKETMEQASKEVSAVTPEQVRDLALKLFAKENRAVAVVGPHTGRNLFSPLTQ